MSAPTTHYLDMETPRFGRRFPERDFPSPLCGAAEMGPVDLTPYDGVVSCADCLAWAAARDASRVPRP